MEREYKNIVLWNNVTPVAVASSTDVSPAVVTTSAPHGYSNDQRVIVFGHSTNITVNGTFRVVVLSPTTFSLVDERTGRAINGAGGGAGSGGFTMVAAAVVYMKDYRNAVLQIGTKGTATLTAKMAISLGCPTPPTGDVSATFEPAMPNFGGTVDAATNPYTFAQIIPLDTATPVNGGTGIVYAGADAIQNYEVNTNAVAFLNLIITAYTQGSISAILFLTNNI